MAGRLSRLPSSESDRLHEALVRLEAREATISKLVEDAEAQNQIISALRGHLKLTDRAISMRLLPDIKNLQGAVRQRDKLISETLQKLPEDVRRSVQDQVIRFPGIQMDERKAEDYENERWKSALEDAEKAKRRQEELVNEISTLKQALASQTTRVVDTQKLSEKLRAEIQTLKDLLKTSERSRETLRETLSKSLTPTPTPSAGKDTPPQDVFEGGVSGLVGEFKDIPLGNIDEKRSRERRRSLERRLADSEAAVVNHAKLTDRLQMKLKHNKSVVARCARALEELSKRGIKGPWDKERSQKARKGREFLLRQWASEESLNRVHELEELAGVLGEKVDPLQKLAAARAVQVSKLRELLEEADNLVVEEKKRTKDAIQETKKAEEKIKAMNSNIHEMNIELRQAREEVSKARTESTEANEKAEQLARTVDVAEGQVENMRRQVVQLREELSAEKEEKERIRKEVLEIKDAEVRKANRLVSKLKRQLRREISKNDDLEKQFVATHAIANALQAQIQFDEQKRNLKNSKGNTRQGRDKSILDNTPPRSPASSDRKSPGAAARAALSQSFSRLFTKRTFLKSNPSPTPKPHVPSPSPEPPSEARGETKSKRNIEGDNGLNPEVLSVSVEVAEEPRAPIIAAPQHLERLKEMKIRKEWEVGTEVEVEMGGKWARAKIRVIISDYPHDWLELWIAEENGQGKREQIRRDDPRLRLPHATASLYVEANGNGCDPAGGGSERSGNVSPTSLGSSDL